VLDAKEFFEGGSSSGDETTDENTAASFEHGVDVDSFINNGNNSEERPISCVDKEGNIVNPNADQRQSQSLSSATVSVGELSSKPPNVVRYHICQLVLIHPPSFCSVSFQSAIPLFLFRAEIPS
jgi:hypothetical protein